MVKSLQSYVQPLIIVTINAGIIPTICDIIASLEYHKTKSSRQVAIMRKNFFFQILNTIFIQITLTTTIDALVKEIDIFTMTFDEVRTLLLSNYINFTFLALAI